MISGGDFNAALAEIAIPGVAIAGARGGFSHPLTSYTLPFAVDNALAIARLIATRPDLTGEQLAAFCTRRAKRHWRSTSYYRMLSRMLFEAAEPDKRVVVFEHFYALRGALVERFYAGRSTWPDRLRILTASPDADVLKGRVAEYAHRQGWKGEVVDSEAGILPVISGGDFNAALAEIAIPGVAIAGARGGFSHPLTSYTLPFAVDNALAIARLIATRPDLTGEQLAAFCTRRAKRHWRSTSYYRMLTRMLFEAAEPDKRVVVFEHFYTLRGAIG